MVYSYLYQYVCASTLAQCARLVQVFSSYSQLTNIWYTRWPYHMANSICLHRLHKQLLLMVMCKHVGCTSVINTLYVWSSSNTVVLGYNVIRYARHDIRWQNINCSICTEGKLSRNKNQTTYNTKLRKCRTNTVKCAISQQENKPLCKSVNMWFLQWWTHIFYFNNNQLG